MLAWKRGLLALAILAIAGVAGGCATISTGTTQAINIESQPSGAQCILSREGHTVGVVVTPGQATVGRSRHAIKVVCRKTDYQDTGDFLMAEREPASYIGLVPLFPFSIGGIVDNASGAYARYPAFLKVWLVPNGSSADPANMAPALAAAAGSFDGRYFGAFRSHAILRNFDPIEIDVHVVAGRGSGTAKTDACASSGEVSLVVDPSGAVVGRFQLNDASCQGATMTFTGQIEGGRMNIKIVKKVDASLVKQP